jgi:single-stranded-DNA-specific exonuclease
LIVSVDCGISDGQAVAAARDAGLDVIVTDHHHVDPHALPPARARVHPRLPGSTHPWGDPCGALVAFKLGWHFARRWYGSERLPEGVRRTMLDLLGLAALATVADVVPLQDENRVVASCGLRRLPHSALTGVRALLEAAGLREKRVDAFHVGFVLGPRLNACGRLGSAGKAARLLTLADEEEARSIAEGLCQDNEQRRETEKAVLAEAEQMVRQGGEDQPDRRGIVVAGEDWHPGVAGLVASRLAERYARPAVVLCCENGKARGSARSVDGVPIHEAMRSCAPHLERWGGHAMAAGVTLSREAIPDFRESFVAEMNKKLSPEDLTGVVDVEAECALEEIDVPTCRALARIGPFGCGNPEPLFCVRDVRVEQPPKRMGQDGAHLGLQLRSGNAAPRRAVGFGLGPCAEQLSVGTRLDAVFAPRLSHWNGQMRAELHLQDLRTA